MRQTVDSKRGTSVHVASKCRDVRFSSEFTDERKVFLTVGQSHPLGGYIRLIDYRAEEGRGAVTIVR